MWNGSPRFPDRPFDMDYSAVEMPVSQDSMNHYVLNLVDNVNKRAAWFRTQHVLWPWVSGPHLRPGTVVMGPTLAPGTTPAAVLL